MARGLNMAFLAAIVIAALIQTSVAQTTYTVGDGTGWAIPPGSNSAFYSSWAANKSFNVGDVLVFNFMANAHDVAKVTKADYDACTTSSPISLVATSPANITLDASGEHYFFCNFTGHCSAGQKMMINVSAASSSPSPAPQPSSPAPRPSTPTPQSSPAPSTPTPQSSPAPQPSTPTPQSQSSPAPQPSSSSPAPQPSTSTPASSPSPVTTPPPPPASGPSPVTTPPPPPASGPSPVSTPPPPPASGPSPPSPTPASGPPPTSTPPATVAPPPNSAISLGLAGFTTILSIFVILLCY